MPAAFGLAEDPCNFALPWIFPCRCGACHDDLGTKFFLSPFFTIVLACSFDACRSFWMWPPFFWRGLSWMHAFSCFDWMRFWFVSFVPSTCVATRFRAYAYHCLSSTFACRVVRRMASPSSCVHDCVCLITTPPFCIHRTGSFALLCYCLFLFALLSTETHWIDKDRHGSRGRFSFHALVQSLPSPSRLFFAWERDPTSTIA